MIRWTRHDITTIRAPCMTILMTSWRSQSIQIDSPTRASPDNPSSPGKISQSEVDSWKRVPNTPPHDESHDVYLNLKLCSATTVPRIATIWGNNTHIRRRAKYQIQRLILGRDSRASPRANYPTFYVTTPYIPLHQASPASM